jgi:hypothetical protein
MEFPVTPVQDPPPSDDWFSDVRTTRLDPNTEDRLLAGAVQPDDAPPGYASVAELLQTARSGATTEPHAQDAAVDAMRAAVLTSLESASSATLRTDGRRKMVSKTLTAKAAAAAAVVLLGAGSAAAATGALPGMASSHASHAHNSATSTTHHGRAPAGANTTSASAPASSSSTDSGTVTSNRQGNGPSPNALPGLCRAKIASDGHPNANSVLNTINCTGVTPAGGANSETSGPSPDAPSSGPPHGTGKPAGTPSGTPSSAPVGRPSGTPSSGSAPVATPNHGAASVGHAGGSSASNSANAGH